MAGYDAINRPLLSWDRPLGDASWRRWFDILRAKGVDRIGPQRPQQQLAIDTLLGGEPYTGPVAPNWTDARGSMAALREQTATDDYSKPSHDRFMKRYGR